MKYETVIGLEVHVQLKTRSKLFCGCAVEFGREPNTLTCPVCTGQPGVLPVLNQKALHLALKAGLALHGRIPPVTRFDRKNYFYPDLPKGYQITQLEAPLAEGGWIEFDLPGGGRRVVGITRVHLEEDAGKNLHPEEGTASLIDLNRAGTPLLEIVSASELGSPEEASSLLKSLRRIIRTLGVSSCDMEKGSLRCDANLSLKPAGSDTLGVKTEIKNLNSFRHVEKALFFEAERQRSLLEQGAAVVQETRRWMEKAGCTRAMRSKEEAHDYRYFPEPDLPPFALPQDLVARIEATLPELPLQRGDRFQAEYGLPPKDAQLLAGEKEIADFFEECAGLGRSPGEVSNWIRTAVMTEMNERRLGIHDLNLTPADLASLIERVLEGAISRQAAKKVLPVLIDEGIGPERAIAGMELEQVSDTTVLNRVVDDVLEGCAAMVEEFRAGKEPALNALIGAVMKRTKGKANPVLVRKLLLKKINAEEHQC